MPTETHLPPVTEEELLNQALHELTSIAQMFHSYEQLCENDSFRLSPKICKKCALKLREVRQIIIERIQ